MSSPAKVALTRPAAPKSPQLQNAHAVLLYAIDTVESLLNLYHFLRTQRSARGISTHAEHDLLRAMLVFACAGLDSFLKQALKDAYSIVLDKSSSASDALEKFVSRRITQFGEPGKADDEEAIELKLDRKFLAKALTSRSPRDSMIKESQKVLAAGSLQSQSEISRIVSHLGLDEKAIGLDQAQLRSVFDRRNKIIHEMDMQIGRGRGNRVSPNKEEAERSALYILSLTSEILDQLDLIIR